MGLSVNTNLDAIAALQTLSSIQRQTSRTQRRIATGLRVSSPTDDPSTFAIAQGIRGDIAGFQSISNALALGTAAVNVALQGAQTISDTLNLIKGKIVAAQDPTQDRRALQNDIGSFVAQIDAVAAAAQFNGVSLIGGGAATQNILSSLVRHGATVSVASIPVSAEPLDSGSLGLAGLNVVDQEAQIAIGSNNVSDHDTLSLTVGGQNTTFEFVTSAADTRAASNIAVVIGSSVSGTVAALNAALSRNGFTTSSDQAGNIDVTAHGSITAAASPATAGSLTATVLGAPPTANALGVIERAINITKTALSSLGTSANQLQNQETFTKGLTDALTSGLGTLVDADLAEESANLQALQVREQLAVQVLSIANQQSKAILQLFR